MPPKISILVPLYNSEKYIQETIESCLYQTYKNIEIIIVDDHSTDNSIKKAKEYQQKYPELISVFSNPKKGACAARNYAFERSNGDYIQYLDADDILPLNKIEKQINLLKKGKEYTLTCSWSHFWNDISEAKFNPLNIYKNYTKPYELFTDMITYSEMLTSHSWLTPRSIIKKAGPWNEELLINQDGEFFLRVILNSTRITYSDNNMVLYRQNTGTSITRSKRSYKKVRSELDSINLITYNLLNHINNKKTKRICATMYERFAIKYINEYNDLVIEAVNKRFDFKERSIKNRYPLKTKMLINTIGFRNTIGILKLLK